MKLSFVYQLTNLKLLTTFAEKQIELRNVYEVFLKLRDYFEFIF